MLYRVYLVASNGDYVGAVISDVDRPDACTIASNLNSVFSSCNVQPVLVARMARMDD